MSEWISVEDRLPNDGQWVFVYLPDMPWIDKSPSFQKIAVAQFNLGLEVFSGIIRNCDKHGNNLKSYAWRAFGPSSFLGQDVTHWMPLPGIPK